MCGMFNVDVWDANAEYLVIDDIPFEFFGGSRKALWGAQSEIVITDKYRKKRSVKWGKPMIFCCNPDNDFRLLPDKTRKNLYLRDSELEWYNANTFVVEVINKLY